MEEKEVERLKLELKEEMEAARMEREQANSSVGSR